MRPAMHALKADFRKEIALAIILLASLLLAAHQSSAATISGKIYDLSYDPVTKVLVGINSTPPQTYVAQSGGYAFYLPQGAYLLTATYGTGEAAREMSERLTITDEGNYTLDLVLYDELPNITTSEEDFRNISSALDELSSAAATKPAPWGTILGALAAAIILLIGIWWWMRRKNPATVSKTAHTAEGKQLGFALGAHEHPPHQAHAAKTGSRDSRETILAYLAEHDGRANQKDIRKLLPYSEAKVSLLISELEHDAKIKRIKKGRGNIIVLRDNAGHKSPETPEPPEPSARQGG